MGDEGCEPGFGVGEFEGVGAEEGEWVGIGIGVAIGFGIGIGEAAAGASDGGIVDLGEEGEGVVESWEWSRAD